VLALSVLLLVPTACGGDDATDGASTAVDVSAEATSDGDTSSAEGADPALGAPGTTVPDPRGMADPAACLPSQWTLGADQVQGVFDTSPLAAMSGATVEVTGNGLLDLRDDGTFTFTPAYELVLSVAGEVATGQWSGTQSGAWSVDGTTLTLSDVADDVTGSVTVQGASMELPAPTSFSGPATVVNCSSTMLELTVGSSIGVITQVFAVAA
jgi:hypothetical protein